METYVIFYRPGGIAPIYYANTLIKFISASKYKEEDDGFDGFMVKAELIKSRSNKAGQSCNLIYNQLTGFDPILTLYQYAVDNELVDGRNPYKYFKSNKDIKFDSRTFREAFNTDERIRNMLMESTLPKLEEMLSYVRSE